MSRIRPREERGIPKEERQFSTDFRVCREEERNWGFLRRALRELTFKDSR